MSESLKSFNVGASLAATLQNAIDGGAQTASVPQGSSYTPETNLATGTSANQADRVWSDAGRTLNSGSNETIDMYDLGSLDIGGGAGKDALGQAFALAEVVAILIVNRKASVGNLTIGGDGTTAAWNSAFGGSDTAVSPAIPPGGWWMLFVPSDPALVVTDVTNHLLKLAASGGNVTYDITIIGRSA